MDRCAGCHQQGSDQGPVVSAAHSTFGDRCLKCHSFHSPESIRVSTSARLEGDIPQLDSPHCVACHGPGGKLENLSAGHQVARDLYHRNASNLKDVSPSEACLFCHSPENDNPWQDKLESEAYAIDQHASHPWGVTFRPGQGTSASLIKREIDERLPLSGGRIECETCHQLTSPVEDLLIAYPEKYDLCLGCHAVDGKDQGNSKDVYLATMVKSSDALK